MDKLEPQVRRLCEYDGQPCFNGIAPNDTRLRCGTLACFYGPDALRKAMSKWSTPAKHEAE